MAVHIATGNRLDICYETIVHKDIQGNITYMANGELFLVPWNNPDLKIPLPDPVGFYQTLGKILKERGNNV